MASHNTEPPIINNNQPPKVRCYIVFCGVVLFSWQSATALGAVRDSERAPGFEAGLALAEQSDELLLFVEGLLQDLQHEEDSPLRQREPLRGSASGA